MPPVLSEATQAGYLPDYTKITHPIVYDLANEYADSGIAGHVVSVLHTLPATLQEPVQYTFRHHVTKERPLSVVHAADELSADHDKALGIAACIDVLWNVGIIIDDIYDKDDTNARLQPSAWAQFGKTRALAASTAAVAATVSYVARRYSPRDAYSLSHQLYSGVRSLIQSRSLSLDLSLDHYYANYDMRSGFYTRFPIAALRRYTGANPEQIAGVQNSLARMNRAGQMINDLQDFDESGERSRAASFSDMRNGVSTIPIRHIWNTINDTTRQRFSEVHGNTIFGEKELAFMRKLVRDTGVGQAISGHIASEYAAARDEYIDVLAPSTATVQWLDRWIQYKLAQARTVASTLDESVCN